MEVTDKGWLITTIGVSRWMFLLVQPHPGCPGQSPESRKMVVCVCTVCVVLFFIFEAQRHCYWQVAWENICPLNLLFASLLPVFLFFSCEPGCMKYRDWLYVGGDMYVGQVNSWRACHSGHVVLCCSNACSSQADYFLNVCSTVDFKNSFLHFCICW